MSRAVTLLRPAVCKRFQRRHQFAHSGVNSDSIRHAVDQSRAYAGCRVSARCDLTDGSFVIQTSDGGDGAHPHFVLDRKADQENLWLMPGEFMSRFL